MLFMIAARSAPAGCSARLGPTAQDFYGLPGLSAMHWARCTAAVFHGAGARELSSVQRHTSGSGFAGELPFVLALYSAYVTLHCCAIAV